MEFKLVWAWVILLSTTFSILMVTARLGTHVLLNGVDGIASWLALGILIYFFGFFVIVDYIRVKERWVDRA